MFKRTLRAYARTGRPQDQDRDQSPVDVHVDGSPATQLNRENGETTYEGLTTQILKALVRDDSHALAAVVRSAEQDPCLKRRLVINATLIASQQQGAALETLAAALEELVGRR